MTLILLQAFLAGMGTFLGAALILFFGKINSRVLSLLLALASGIMLSVIFMDLIPSSLIFGSPAQCLTGLLGGFLVVKIMDAFINHGIRHEDNLHSFYLKMGYLIALGIALHDLPEGLAVAAGFSSPGSLGAMIALAIGLHNIPEGMATAAPLKAGGASTSSILGINAAVSIVTPLGTLLGLFILAVTPSLISVLLAFAAGAMSYIVKSELIPESYRFGKKLALQGIIAGFLLMSVISLLFQ